MSILYVPSILGQMQNIPTQCKCSSKCWARGVTPGEGLHGTTHPCPSRTTWWVCSKFEDSPPNVIKLCRMVAMLPTARKVSTMKLKCKGAVQYAKHSSWAALKFTRVVITLTMKPYYKNLNKGFYIDPRIYALTFFKLYTAVQNCQHIVNDLVLQQKFSTFSSCLISLVWQISAITQWAVKNNHLQGVAAVVDSAVQKQQPEEAEARVSHRGSQPVGPWKVIVWPMRPPGLQHALKARWG